MFVGYVVFVMVSGTWKMERLKMLGNIRTFKDVIDAGYTIKRRYKLSTVLGLAFLGFALKGKDNSYIGWFESMFGLINYVDTMEAKNAK